MDFPYIFLTLHFLKFLFVDLFLRFLNFSFYILIRGNSLQSIFINLIFINLIINSL